MDRIVILGGGESGIGSAVLAQKKGFEVFLSDSSILTIEYRTALEAHGITFEEGKHTEELILNAKEIIKSPGIPENVTIVKQAREKGIPIISEIEFAGRYCNAKKICITGSNGKTTTVSLIYFLLKNAGLNVGLAGNVGSSYALQVATMQHDYYVLELSSFQLDGVYNFKADIAVLLNITPDHLDRYQYDLQKYIDAKFRITRNLNKEDCFIFCSDDEITMANLNKIVLQTKMLPFSQNTKVNEGAYLENDTMYASYNASEFGIPVSDIAIKGKHNVYNSMAAAITGKILNIQNKVIRESLEEFKGVEHRLEKVLKIKGIQFINDSKATNVNSAWYALESMDTKVIWIMGGTDKGNDYTSLLSLAKEKVKAIVCLGVDNKKIIEAFKGSVPLIVETKSAKSAVEAAYELGEAGDTVLLSPACASFDLFDNYEDRGQKFKEAVRNL